MPFLRRLAFAPLVLIAVTFVTYGIPRVLRPDLYVGEQFVSGLVGDVNRALLHFDFGRSINLPRNPPVNDLWAAGLVWDLWLVAGGLLVGAVGGIAAGIYCARRPRSLRSRAVEAIAMAAYCSPVFFTGLFLLYLFNSTYGRVPVPVFFDAAPQWAQPWTDPWSFLNAMLVPWLVLGAPLGAMCLRLTLSTTREAMDEDFVRTAEAKGVASKRIVRRHAAPLSFPATVSFVGVSAPLLVTNAVLIERVFSVPGFFRYMWRASGHAALDEDPYPDFDLLCALGLWTAVLLIVIVLVADGLVSLIDPHVRTSAEQAW